MKSGVWIFSLAVTCLAAPSAEKPVILNQKIEGRLGARWQVNIGYLRGLYDEQGARMLAPFQNRDGGYKRLRDWDGEYAGKWLDAAARVPKADAPDLRRRVEKFAAALRATQESDGYFGIDSRERRGRVTWDVWNQWYVLTGLLTHYEHTKDRESLEAAARIARWLIRAYGDVDRPNHPFFKAAHRGGCNVDVIGQLVRLHATRPTPPYCVSCAAWWPISATWRQCGEAASRSWCTRTSCSRTLAGSWTWLAGAENGPALAGSNW